MNDRPTNHYTEVAVEESLMEAMLSMEALAPEQTASTMTTEELLRERKDVGDSVGQEFFPSEGLDAELEWLGEVEDELKRRGVKG